MRHWQNSGNRYRKFLAPGLALVLGLAVFGGCGGTQTVQPETPGQSEQAGTADDGTASSAQGQITPVQVKMQPARLAVAEPAEVYVEPVEGLAEDFIRGMDISSVISLEESGVVYYNEDGQPADLFEILAGAGVNYIRVRVWNHPYDDKGNGYGGGNCDVEKAAVIGRRAAECGMKLLVDFHYSDFWADPAKQYAPREWKQMIQEQKRQAIYDYTVESLKTIAAGGADIGMVQIGNEINNGMAGEKDEERKMALLHQASAAVRAFCQETGTNAKIAVHFTNIENKDNILNQAKIFEKAGLDYDVFGVSYYAYWHGKMDNLTNVLAELKKTYGKETCVLETSYAYTLEDGDGFANSVSEKDLTRGYAATVQSQASCIRDICAAANAADSLGVFYWEGAWIPVGPVNDYEGNSALWEKFGSGWASSYSSKYDPNDAGIYYGGCSWDNQAMFDWSGHPLPSLNVFKYLDHGTICEPAVDYLEAIRIDVNVGDELVMPEAVNAVFNDRTKSGPVPVVWDEAQVAAIDTDVMADHVVDGVLEDGTAVKADVVVAKLNYVQNASFEDKDASMWKIRYDGDSDPTDIQTKETDAFTGENSLHFWRKNDFSFNAEQTVTGLTPGRYTLTAKIQGGDMGSGAEIYLYAVPSDLYPDAGELAPGTYQLPNIQILHSDKVEAGGWIVWQSPEINDIELTGDTITVGIAVKSAGGGWGTIDDFYLYKQ